MRFLAAALLLGLAGCATPYQEMGFLGGVQATQVTQDTFQIAARGNAYTGADTIQRYALRKAAETTVAAGYDLFMLGDRQDRTRRATVISGDASDGSFSGFAQTLVKPGETVLVKMFKGAKPADAPANLFDARDVLKYLGQPTTVH